MLSTLLPAADPAVATTRCGGRVRLPDSAAIAWRFLADLGLGRASVVVGAGDAPTCDTWAHRICGLATGRYWLADVAVAIDLRPIGGAAVPFALTADLDGGQGCSGLALLVAVDAHGTLWLLDPENAAAARLLTDRVEVTLTPADDIPGGIDCGRRRACLLWARAGVAR